MLSTTQRPIAACEEYVPSCHSIELIVGWRKLNLDKLANDPPERARYERGIKNLEQAINEWKVHNPHEADPYDDDAWAKRCKRKEQERLSPTAPPPTNDDIPPEWIARRQKIIEINRSRNVVSLAEQRLATEKHRPKTVYNNESDIHTSRPSGTSAALDAPLPYVDLTLDLVPRQWLVPERIPMHNVSLLSGEGAIGKSLLLMQLSGAVVLGGRWLGLRPLQGPVLYMSCEEDDDEVRRRMEDVARHLGASRADMIEHGLRFLSYAGRDAILAQPERSGIMEPTPLFGQLRRDALQLRPKLIVLDTVADTFAGKENDRAQTRQFITMARGLGIEASAAVILAAHPSLTGIATDTGLSGNTGWHNSVRARMYFKAAPGDDPALRVLEVRKNNYGPVAENIMLRWHDGIYLVEGFGSGPTAEQVLERLAEEERIDQLFLTLLRRFTKQKRNVTDKPSATYAPTQFAGQPEAKRDKVTKKALAEAMTRLFARDKLTIVTEGPQSRPRSKIVEAEGKPAYSASPSNDPSNDPSNALPTPSNALSTHTPPYPPARWNGPAGVGRARPSQRGSLLKPRLRAQAAEERDAGMARARASWGRARGGPDHCHAARPRSPGSFRKHRGVGKNPAV